MNWLENFIDKLTGVITIVIVVSSFFYMGFKVGEGYGFDSGVKWKAPMECSCSSNILEQLPLGEVHRDHNRTSIIWKNKCNQAKMRLIIFDRGDSCN